MNQVQIFLAGHGLKHPLGLSKGSWYIRFNSWFNIVGTGVERNAYGISLKSASDC